MPAESQIPETAGRAPDWGALLWFQAALGAVVAFLTTLIWAVTGHGFFWPMWVWFGVAVPIGIQARVRRAILTTEGLRRGLAIHGAVSGVLAAVEILIWLMTGMGLFWPIFPIALFALAYTAHLLAVTRLAPQARQELVQRVDELTRTRRGALDVQAAELRRIERDLHDGAQARLVALSMQLGRAEARLADRPEEAELLRQARAEAGAAIAELRDLARGIAPPVLADRGLGAAVEALGRRAATPVELELTIDRRPLPVLETAAYFVVAEALTNVAKHAPGATARVGIVLGDEQLVVSVADDGPGGADPEGGGLTGLRGRVEALDGELSVISEPGVGTTIRAELPCAS
jgi:signal transduction histidine kinase